jgi:hypothetical protein
MTTPSCEENETSERIVRLQMAGDHGGSYRVGEGIGGGPEVVTIKEFFRPGQMAEVPWYLVILADDSYYEVNAAHVESVKKEAPHE